jgi:hypothetical protein
MHKPSVTLGLLLVVTLTQSASAISLVVDYTLDEMNEQWFDPQTSDGLMRRQAVDSAAGFLSAVITNDDWQSLGSLDELFSLSDIAASSIIGLDGNPLNGTAESDGAGYAYSGSGNGIRTTNRSSVGANEYVVYVGAFTFDAGNSANAKASWSSSDRRNAAGEAGLEFNTWGGCLYFNTTKNWYAESNPGIDPTDDYGVQDTNKNPTTDISSDNWDWSTATDSWKGFDLRTIDTAAIGRPDLYATALHELMHALGATTSIIEDYVGVAANGDFIGTNLMQVYGGPVPGDGGHFAANVESLVWASDDIVSEAVLDPSSLSGVRKYFTQIDAALLRDLGYQVLSEFAAPPLAGDYDGNGTVDASDYTVWRDSLGAVGAGLAADGTGPEGMPDGMVDQLDYALWKTNFGMSAMVESQQNASLAPEPTSMFLALIAVFGWVGMQRSELRVLRAS